MHSSSIWIEAPARGTADEAIVLPPLARHRDFEHAIRAYSGELYAFAYWLCRDRQRARDLVQEACLRAWNAWDSRT